MVQRYLMIGAGGTGSHLLDPCLRYLRSFHGGTDPGVWQFGIMDGDSLEEHNLDRQIFGADQVKMNKAQAAAARSMLPNVAAIPEYLGRHNIPLFIDDGTVILIAADNFPVRSLIEQYCSSLANTVVINGGNELATGSCQIWVRKDGENLTPPLSFLHPEINAPGEDRAEMTCEQIAKLPGGEQLIAVNAMSSVMMLTALIKYHRGQTDWTEVQFNILSGESFAMDQRERRGWRPDPPEDVIIPALAVPEIPVVALPN